MYLIAFSLLFRISELVFTTQSQYDRPLIVSDLKFYKRDGKLSVKLRIRRSKNKQSGSPQTLSISLVEMCPLWPVSALKKYKSIKPYSMFLTLLQGISLWQFKKMHTLFGPPLQQITAAQFSHWGRNLSWIARDTLRYHHGKRMMVVKSIY
jgi:hypothetical protein